MSKRMQYVREFTSLLSECLEAGIYTADVASAAKWALVNDALTIAKLDAHISVLAARLQQHHRRAS